MRNSIYSCVNRLTSACSRTPAKLAPLMRGVKVRSEVTREVFTDHILEFKLPLSTTAVIPICLAGNSERAGES
jgi:hypothetical protein